MIKERNGIINSNFRIVFNSLGEDKVLIGEGFNAYNFNDDDSIFLKLGTKVVNFTIFFLFIRFIHILHLLTFNLIQDLF